MKRDRRVLILLGAVFVALAALVLLQGQPAPTSPYSTARVFDGFTLDEIQAIRLRNPSGSETFMISRAVDGMWTAPEAAGTLNVGVADLIARTMILLPYINQLDRTGEPEAYGFLPTAGLAVEFILANGTTHAIIVGFRNPTETGYYAVVDNREEIYILERAAVDFLISVLRSPPVA